MDIDEKLVILGSGPAGLTAGIYASRAHINPLIVEGAEPGGQLMGTTVIENWPAVPNIMGPVLMGQMREHAIKFGTKFLSQEVIKTDLSKKPFKIFTNKNVTINAESLIIATGATAKRLHCPGESKFWGKGVTTCAVCDGAFYPNKHVIIVGGGDTAMENASFMTNFTDKITIVHILPKLTASYAMQQRVINDPKISIIYNATVSEILGENHVEKVVITHQESKAHSLLQADAVFISIGLKPNTAIFKDQLELTDYGYIQLKEHTQTSVKGVFASGDVADSRYRQAITSAGSGCAAALDAERYLKEAECI